MYDINLKDLSCQQTSDEVAVSLRPLFASELAKSLQGFRMDATSGRDLNRLCRRLYDAAAVYGFKDLATFIGKSKVMIMTGCLSPHRFLDIMQDVQRRISLDS